MNSGRLKSETVLFSLKRRCLTNFYILVNNNQNNVLSLLTVDIHTYLSPHVRHAATLGSRFNNHVLQTKKTVACNGLCQDCAAGDQPRSHSLSLRHVSIYYLMEGLCQAQESLNKHFLLECDGSAHALGKRSARGGRVTKAREVRKLAGVTQPGGCGTRLRAQVPPQHPTGGDADQLYERHAANKKGILSGPIVKKCSCHAH